MSATAEELYALLPAVYRVRDPELGDPLKALITVLAEQAGVMEKDIARLYDNWFIETCEEWVVPYLGDLLGVRGLHSIEGTTFTQRAAVANTLGYRRRKGTATMLEQLARDITGWNARAVEFFELLGWTQNYNHIRLHNFRTPDLRLTSDLDLLDTAFDRIAHTVDVRHIANARGRHNIPNVGLFLWRLQDYPQTRVTACPFPGPPAGAFTFSPLGLDAPLFNSPQPETEITHLAEEINVPAELRRRPLYDDLEKFRQTLTDGGTVSTHYFGGRPVFKVYVQNAPGDSFLQAQPDQILICNLTDWRQPPANKGYNKSSKPPYDPADPNPPDKSFPITVAVDPVLGRMTFPTGVIPNAVGVDFAYGFSGDLGGGPYDRGDSVRAVRTLDNKNGLLDKVHWPVVVSQSLPPIPDAVFPTMADAVDAWNQKAPGTIGAIAILDSRTYIEDLTAGHRIKIPEGSQLMIVAGDLPEDQPVKSVIAKNHRAHLRGNISVEGTASATSGLPGELILNGLLIEGDLKVLVGHLGGLRLDHCTMVPGQGVLKVNGDHPALKLRVTRSICDEITVPEDIGSLRLEESIVHGSIIAPTVNLAVEKSTVLGQTTARQLEAGNSIFPGLVTIGRRQVGCVRFCSLAKDSITPRRFRCQPDLALEGIGPLSQQTAIRTRLAPSFTSTHYSHPAYAQLSLACATEIRTGAEDGSEMGAFNFLKQPQRETNLRSSLDEYLRFGLEAGLIFVN
jgi:hypothetical protein